MIICLTERLMLGEKEVRRRQRTLKPEYEETWAAVDQPQGEKLSFQPSWESTEKEVWLIHIRSNTPFINTHTPSREAHLESSRKWHWQIKGPLKNTKEIHVKAKAPKPVIILLPPTFLPISLSFPHRGGMRVNSSVWVWKWWGAGDGHLNYSGRGKSPYLPGTYPHCLFRCSWKTHSLVQRECRHHWCHMPAESLFLSTGRRLKTGSPSCHHSARI